MKKYLITIFAVAVTVIAMAAGTKVWVYSHSGNHRSIDIADFDSLSFVEPGLLEISPIEKKIGNEGGRFTLEITANKPWTASSNDPAVILGTTQGTGNAKIACTAMPNTEEEPYTAIITVTLEDGTYKQALVTVGLGKGKVESVSLRCSEYTIHEKHLDLNLKKELVIIPSGIIDTCKITWNVSDSNIAEIDGNYLVPHKPGEVKVAATIQGKSATCKVNITEQPVTDIKLLDAEINAGESITMSAVTEPKNLPLTKFKWKSSDANTVQAHPDGIIKGVKPGSATITASYGDDISSTATVTVLPVRVESVTLKPATSPQTFTDLGDKIQLDVTVKPKNATDKTVTWNSSNTSVATIQKHPDIDTRYIVTCVGVGESVISATADGVTAKVSVVFSAIPVSSITLTKTSHLFTKTNQAITLCATVKPDNATDKSVTWTSSNTSVATVNCGVVVCKGYGSAVITATAGSQSATCDIIAYEAGTVTDCRNNTYNTVKIASKWWMAENLRCDKYDSQSSRAGNTISGGTDFIDARLTSNWYTSEYAGELSYEQQQKLGYLYTWYAAAAVSKGDFPSNPQGICPDGWKIPSLDDWSDLCEAVSGSKLISDNDAGTKLKTTSGWVNQWNGTDLYRFSALPSGVVDFWYQGSKNYKANYVGSRALYWSSSTATQYSTYYIVIPASGNRMYRGYEYDNEDFMAVRCVKD